MAKQILLLTAYKPFDGRAINGSATLLAWAKRHQARWSDHYDTRTLLLPVEWTAAVNRVRSAIIRFRPDVLLGMGECRAEHIAWEQRAHNQAVGRDEAGEDRNGPINPTLPDHLDARWPVDFSNEETRWPIVQSQDCGKYLCNRILWEAIQSNVPKAAFLHLPQQRQTPNVEYIHGIHAALERALDPKSSHQTT
jgi:pyrrolidone-carboxylate peptidase